MQIIQNMQDIVIVGQDPVDRVFGWHTLKSILHYSDAQVSIQCHKLEFLDQDIHKFHSITGLQDRKSHPIQYYFRILLCLIILIITIPDP